MAAKKGFFGKSYPGLDAKQVRGYSKKEAARMAAADADKLARNKAYTLTKEKAARRLAVDAASENRSIAKRLGNVSNYQKLLKKAGVSLLSPAGMAEGVAGAAAKWATEDKFKREARAESKPRKSGMKPVRTKA